MPEPTAHQTDTLDEFFASLGPVDGPRLRRWWERVVAGDKPTEQKQPAGTK